MRDWARAFWMWLSTGFRAAPVLSSCTLVSTLGFAIQAPAQAYAVKLLVDGIALHDSERMIWAAVILGAGITFFFGVGMASWAIQSTAIDRVHDHVHGDLIRLTTGIPSIVHHERPDIADRIELLHKKSRQLSEDRKSVV